MRRVYSLISTIVVVCLVAIVATYGPAPVRGSTPDPATAGGVAVAPNWVASHWVYLPWITSENVCQPVPGASYASLSVNPPPSDRPAEAHADLNLALRSYTPTGGFLGLVDYSGATDPNAPQLPWLFQNRRTPSFVANYRVYDWNWGCNCRGNPIGSPEVTLTSMATQPGEIISAPAAGYNIGDGYSMLVLYANEERLTLKFTRNDNVVSGYTIHLENLCVEPGLLQLYRSLNASGRGQLPALRGGQAVGRARSTSISASVRDNGTFMDPRSRKDWWQGH